MWMMCDDCGSLVAANAGRCPVCGARVEPPPPWNGPRHLLAGLVVAGAVAFATLVTVLVAGLPAPG